MSRTLAAGLLGVVLTATAGLAVWLVVTSGVLTAPPSRPEAPLTALATPTPRPAPPLRVGGVLQLAQPRDPFRPLVTPESPAGGIPGGELGGGVPGTVLTLEKVTSVGGTLRATILVDGVVYDVGEGETFAGSYKLVDLTEERAIIMFGDTAFELRVGQQILK